MVPLPLFIGSRTVGKFRLATRVAGAAPTGSTPGGMIGVNSCRTASECGYAFRRRATHGGLAEAASKYDLLKHWRSPRQAGRAPRLIVAAQP